MLRTCNMGLMGLLGQVSARVSGAGCYCPILFLLPSLLLVLLLSPSAIPFTGLTSITGHGLRCSGLSPLSLALSCGSGFQASVLRACFGRHRHVTYHLQPSPTPPRSRGLGLGFQGFGFELRGREDEGVGLGVSEKGRVI